MSSKGVLSGSDEAPAGLSPPGPEDLPELRITAALIGLAVLAGLLMILGTAVGQATSSRGTFSITLSGACGVFLAAALLYLSSLTTMRAAPAVRGGDGPVRHRGRAPVLAFAVLAAVALPACGITPGLPRTGATPGLQATSAGGTPVLRGHGVSFGYPAGWSAGSPQEGTRTGHLLWAAAVGPGTPHDYIDVEAYSLIFPVTAQNIDALVPIMTVTLRQAGATIEGTSGITTMAGLPALLFHTSGTTGGTRFQSRLVFAFTGETEYEVNCQYTAARAAEVEQACNQVVGSFRIGKASTGVARPGILASQQAQSDLWVLQQFGVSRGITGDLRILTSDARQMGADLATLKSDDLGTGCSVVSIVKTDASTVGIDASTFRSDLEGVTADIGTAAQDLAALKKDLADLRTSGLPPMSGAVNAIATASPVIQQAIRKANGEIDQVNADVTQAYSLANRMATGECPGQGPGRAPAQISHIFGK